MTSVEVSAAPICLTDEYKRWLRDMAQVMAPLFILSKDEPDYERVFCHNPVCHKLQLELPKNRTEKARIKCRYCNNWNVY